MGKREAGRGKSTARSSTLWRTVTKRRCTRFTLPSSRFPLPPLTGGSMKRNLVGAVIVGLCAVTAPAFGQYPAGQYYTPNVKLVSHVPLGAENTVMDIEIEQDLSRPYVYVTRSNYARLTPPPIGFDIVSLKDPSKARVL